MTPFTCFSFGIIFTCCFAAIPCLVLTAVLDNYFIDCGANSSTTMSGRKWVGDSFATNVTVFPLGISTTTFSVSSSAPYSDLYRTARIFTTAANYSFKISSPGHHWIRLHFYPFTFKDFSVISSVFSVNTASLQLLSNLRVSYEISIRNEHIQYPLSERPNIVYVIKEYLINFKSRELVITFVPGSGSFAFINAIEVVSMPKGLFKNSLDLVGSSSKRILVQDDSHSVETVYRLNDGRKSIEPENDSGGMSSNKYSLSGSPRKTEEAGIPSGKNEYYKIVGFSIGGTAIITAAIVGLCLFCLKFVNPQSPGWLPWFFPARSDSNTINSAGRARRFTYTEINVAIGSFDESRVIGNGGFGKVYKGELEDDTVVAVKRANPESEQGLTEFKTEIEVLSQLSHHNLVSLIGYCEDQNELILVYEYMANGTLRNHFFGSNLPPLSWKQRLEICIGAARGLHYLHTGTETGIIHRDVKATNILLDENFVAKIADFGLSKRVPALDHTHVSTNVKGSFGYLDPEYYRNQQLTMKSDVYSFGVVLFEVICARPAINPTLPKEQINLAAWAMHWQQSGMVEQIIDPHLAGAYSLDSLRKFGEIAEKCLADDGMNRPTTGDVLRDLEYALQLQEAAVRSVPLNNSSSQLASIVLNLPGMGETDEHDESTLIQDQDRETGESTLVQHQDPHIDESTLVRDRDRQTVESRLVQDRDQQTGESALVQNQDEQIDERSGEAQEATGSLTFSSLGNLVIIASVGAVLALGFLSTIASTRTRSRR